LNRNVATASRVQPDATPRGRGSGVFIHAAAICESDRIGEGTRVWAFAHVLQGAVIGRDCNIGDHAYLEGGVCVGDRVTIKNGAMLFAGVTLDDDVFIGPGVVFTNDERPRSPRMAEVSRRYSCDDWLGSTTVRRGATLGARTTVLPALEIGEYAMVGASALVTRSVAPHQLVVGHPAKPIGWACVCGQRVEAPWRCAACGRDLMMREGRLQAAE